MNKSKIENTEEEAFIPVGDNFFLRPTLELAQSLLGCTLVHESKEGTIAGRIVETEAYRGPMDQAAHSYQNRRTKRTEIMFAEPGRIYTYTMHTHCLINVVSADREVPEAVLIRALEPVLGLSLMEKNRGIKDIRQLTNGPGKLTKALGITMDHYGGSFTHNPLFIAEGISPEAISTGRRIGIDNSGDAKDYPWRFWITGNPFVSRHTKK